MCGIFAYITHNVPQTRRHILASLLDGLQAMEYEGCDSAGIAIDDPNAPNGVAVVRAVGDVEALRAVCKHCFLESDLAVQGCFSKKKLWYVIFCQIFFCIFFVGKQLKASLLLALWNARQHLDTHVGQLTEHQVKKMPTHSHLGTFTAALIFSKFNICLISSMPQSCVHADKPAEEKPAALLKKSEWPFSFMGVFCGTGG